MDCEGEVKRICGIWLNKAFECGQACPRGSTEQSEFYAPHFHYDLVPKMVAEILDATKGD
jgi:hypothetical protein